MMDITLSNIVVWIVVGYLAGSAAGMAYRRRKKGLGLLGNLGVGMVGALIGGLLSSIFNFDLGLGSFTVSLSQLVWAFVGSILFLVILSAIGRSRTGTAEED
jgi:uncharacterized membrane protein YeaQ/YmgE (transglycosylase-associated protein family)